MLPSFRPGARNTAHAIAAVSWIATMGSAHAADLHGNTAEAFDRYVRLTEVRLSDEAHSTDRFLWIDGLTEARRHEADVSLHRGEVIVHRMETRDAGLPIEIPGGLCHHWIGTVFIPGVNLDRTAAFMQSYGAYQDIYKPAVRRSRILSRDGDRFIVFLQLFMRKAVGVVLNTEYDVSYVRLSPKRMHVRSATTRIAEVQHADTSEEREKSVGHDTGFLWRFNNYCGLEERNDGTYVQCESVSLSRNIPAGLGWLIGPFVTSVPRESLEFTLQTMRGALTTHSHITPS